MLTLQMTETSATRNDRRLTTAARALLIPLCLFSLGAGYFVPDRGKDFQTVYLSTAAWAQGALPYATGQTVVNLNHPLMMLVVWPLVSLPFANALQVWTTLSIVTMCIVSAIIAQRLPMPALDVALLTLSVTGTLVALSLGQFTAVVMALFTAAWLADRRGNEVLAGGCLGLLCLLKPFYGLFLLYLIWRQEWRGLIGAAITGGVGTLVGIAMVGVGEYRAWLANLQNVRWQSNLYNASVWGIGDRLFTDSPEKAGASWTPLIAAPPLSRTFGLVASAVFLLWLWRRRSATDHDQHYALLSLGSLIVSPLGWIYYLAVGAGPLIAVLARRPSRWYWALGALAALPYPLIVDRHYERLGTLLVGQWAFVVLISLAFAVSSSRRSLTNP